jgi:hypothetical protein
MLSARALRTLFTPNSRHLATRTSAHHQTDIGRTLLPSRNVLGRLFSSKRPEVLGGAFWNRNRAVLVIGLAAVSASSALAGYLLAQSNQSPTIEATSESKISPQYGTPEDFERAIEDLRALFSGDEVVSTDPEDLRIHGFSEYDYHPSMSRHLFSSPPSH